MVWIVGILNKKVILLKKLIKPNNKGKNTINIGKYVIESVDKRNILLKRLPTGYRISVSVVDLRLGNYILRTKDGYLRFKPIPDYKKLFRGPSEPRRGAKKIDVARLRELCGLYGVSVRARERIAGEMGFSKAGIYGAIRKNKVK